MSGAAQQPRCQWWTAGLAAVAAQLSVVGLRAACNQGQTDAFTVPVLPRSSHNPAPCSLLSHGVLAPPIAARWTIPQVYVVLATALAGGALRRSRATARRQQGRGAATSLAASAEESLFNTIDRFGDNNADAISRVQRSCAGMDRPGSDALKLFEGDWKVVWNSNTANGGRNTMLKFVSYQVLPSVLVTFFRTYIRVTADGYKIVTAFTMPGHESCDAAMVLNAERDKKSKGATCGFTSKTVQVVESDSVTNHSQEMLESAGLSRFSRPTPIKSGPDPTFVEIEAISENMAMFKTEAGVRWVCKRLSGEMNYCIPFKI